MDATRLTDVRLRKAWIEPDQLTSLIERASNLHWIELSFFSCGVKCKGGRLQANKNVLMALASHENLTTIKFDYVSWGACKCAHFESELIKMLKTIGHRGRLRNLAMGHLLLWTTPDIDINKIYTTIHDCIPYLQSITAYDLTAASLFNIVSLPELEEINFVRYGTMTAENVIGKIAQLSRLKRLAIGRIKKEDTDSLVRLTDVKALTDLGIGDASCIGADVFAKWSDGFASNLQTLMLRKVAMENEKGLVQLLEKAARLRVLILCGHITDRSLMAIAKSCPKLEVLGVQSSSKEITAGYLQEILDRCPNLKRFGGFDDEIRKTLQFPKYRKIRNVDMGIWKYDDDDGYD